RPGISLKNANFGGPSSKMITVNGGDFGNTINRPCLDQQRFQDRLSAGSLVVWRRLSMPSWIKPGLSAPPVGSAVATRLDPP
ncbi:MAG TPA: hypothetical protein VGS13_09900, partial [Stellaceae bacterium]|nr:hypothetical protein [Stellaceae bacterium]